MAGKAAVIGEMEVTISATYNEVAGTGASRVCCAPVVIYSPDELASLPEDVLRMSSGCGHPVGASEIAPGSTVVDIGSGAGLDCIMAARRTGPRGRVIGVDPSAKMRERGAKYARELGLTWVSFVEGTAEQLPIPDASVDLVTSNCVLSLALDPARVWREVARVLRPDGRFTVSDIIGGQKAETAVTKARCETGVDWTNYRGYLQAAGFSGIRVLAAGAVQFRDGKRIQSATLHGKKGATHATPFVQIFHPGLSQDVLDRAMVALAASARAHGVRYDLEALDLRDAGAAGIFSLIASDDVATVAPARGERMYVAVDGGLTSYRDRDELQEQVERAWP